MWPVRSSRLAEPGPATLWTAPVVLAVIAVISFQLLPELPLERLRLRLAALRPLPLGASLALVIAFVGATVPKPAHDRRPQESPERGRAGHPPEPAPARPPRGGL